MESDPSSLFSIEANHRIANSLAVIAGLVQLQAMQISKRGQDMSWREVQFVLDDVATQIKTVGLLHRLLAEGPQHDTVELGKYLREICATLIKAFAWQVEFGDPTAGTCVVASQKAVPLGVIVSELVTNAIKYAHPTGIAGRIRIGCHRGADDSISIVFADDGVGLPENFDTTSDGGLGLRVVRLLSAQLGGSVRFESTSLGLQVHLTVPASA